MANADKKPSFGDRVEVFCMIVLAVGLLLGVFAAVAWIGAMAISSIDCEFDPASKRCQIVHAQDQEAAARFGL